MGLVLDVVADGTVVDRALETARLIRDNAPFGDVDDQGDDVADARRAVAPPRHRHREPHPDHVQRHRRTRRSHPSVPREAATAMERSLTMSKLTDDPRIDPRIKAIMGMMPDMEPTDVDSREQLLAEVNTPEAVGSAEQMKALLDMVDNEDVAPSAGLAIETHEFTSSPDGNTIKIQFIRPDGDEILPVRLLHPRRRHAVHVGLRRHVPGVGQDHRRPGRLPSSWSTSATRSSRRRRPRSRRSLPASTTASPASSGSSPTPATLEHRPGAHRSSRARAAAAT